MMHMSLIRENVYSYMWGKTKFIIKLIVRRKARNKTNVIKLIVRRKTKTRTNMMEEKS